MRVPDRFFEPKSPNIHPSVFVAASADVVGDVTLREGCSVWYQAVLRGDINRIDIGAGSNLQDGVIVHLSNDLPVLVGERVTVGHRATLHACTVEDEVLVGMGATVMDGAVVGSQSMVAAGALVSPGTIIPSGSLVMGMPGKVVRKLSEEERERIGALAAKYMVIAKHYREKLGCGKGVEI